MFSIGEESSKVGTTDQAASAVEFILFDDEANQQQQGQSNNAYMYDSDEDDDELGTTFHSTGSLSTADGIVVLGGSSRIQADSTFVHWNSNWTGRLLNNLLFKRALLALLIAHSVIVAISTTGYVRNHENSNEMSSMFWWVRQGFLYLFTLELVLRLIRHRANIFKSGWLCFDFFVITLSWFLPQLLILRTFRVLRSLRHATRFSHLREIIYALGRAVPNSMAIVGLLGMIFYIFAVIFTSMYKESFQEFSRLDITLLTLFQVMTLDEWSELARRVMADSPWAWVLFCSFITTSALFLVNFIVAVIIQALMSPPAAPNNGSSRTVNRGAIARSPRSLHRRDAQRFEAKLDQLVGIVEAIRQKQAHMDSMMSKQDSSPRTAPTVAATMFDDETTMRDTTAGTFIFDALKD